MQKHPLNRKANCGAGVSGVLVTEVSPTIYAYGHDMYVVRVLKWYTGLQASLIRTHPFRMQVWIKRGTG